MLLKIMLYVIRLFVSFRLVFLIFESFVFGRVFICVSFVIRRRLISF